MSEITHVKMCVDPDKVCLQGGCLYCNGGTYKTVSWLENYSVRKKLEKDFNYGARTGWPNLLKKVK